MCVRSVREAQRDFPRAALGSARVSRLAELEVLRAARIADLLAPGQVLLRLAVAGVACVKLGGWLSR
jgi:hypothetical protein